MRKQHVYFLGLEHPAMAGMALALKQLGFAVSGSGFEMDQVIMNQLQQGGVHFYQIFQTQHVHSDSLLVLAPHIAKNNIELKMAQKMKLEIVSLAQLIQQVSQHQYQVLVIDSPTMAAMIANTLQSTDKDSDLISNHLVAPTNHWPQASAVHFAAKPWLVIDGQWHPASAIDKATDWLYYKPRLVVIGHKPQTKRSQSFYKDLQHLLDHLKQTDSSPISPTIIISDLDKQALRLVSQAKLNHVVYGQTTSADWRATDIESSQHVTSFKAVHSKHKLSIQTEQLGQQAVANILGTLALTDLFEIDPALVLAGIVNSNGLYYDQHLQDTLSDIKLYHLRPPWPVDTKPLFDHLRHHLLPDKSAKLWLVCHSQHDLDWLEGLAVDVVVFLQDGHSVDGKAIKLSPTTVKYHLPSSQAIHFMSQHLQAGDVVCHISADWSTTSFLQRLGTALNSRTKENS